MSKSIHSVEQERLRALLIRKRREAGLTQDQLARRLGVYQSFVSKYETGERRLDVFELATIAEAMGLDPVEMLREVRG